MIAERFIPELATEHDVCVVGAGPVGVSLALELARNGSRVLLLEAGPPDECRVPAEPSYIPASAKNAPSKATTRIGFGGASDSWGSGCTPYDPLDFANRSHVPHSGSPVAYNEIARFHAAASSYLGCEDTFEIANEASHRPVNLSRIITYSRKQNIAEAHRSKLEQAENIVVCANTSVLRLVPTPGTQSIEALDILSHDTAFRLKAHKVVLACGGIGSARLLLDMQGDHPSFLLGEEGALGRYYMGHLSGQIARIQFSDKATASKFCFQQSPSGAFYRRRITFSPELQEQNELLNIYFLPTNFPLADAGMCSPVLSALHLGLTARHFTSHYMRHYLPDYSENPLAPRFSFGRHMRNVMRDPVDMVRGVTDVIRQRLSHDTGRPPGFHHNTKSGIFALGYHSEQAPNPDSRVTLSDQRDKNGVRLPIADLRFTERDYSSVEQSHRLLDDHLRSSGWASLDYMQPYDQINEHIRSQAVDGYHQIGLTRISETPATGVVDRDLKVHGMNNLWVSSTGILPASSQAHPTFCAVAFAVRLAEHLTG